MKLKKGNQVQILSGKDKGKTGEILAINRKAEKIKVIAKSICIIFDKIIIILLIKL